MLGFGDSVGVQGWSAEHIGVFGATGDWYTSGGTGVMGFAGTDRPAARAQTGVYGGAEGNGTGVYATAATGYALRTSGRLKADKVSGVATIRAGKGSVTVSPGVDVTTGSFVLLTPKANIGSRALWYTTSPTANTFTIRLSSSRSSATTVAWLLLG